MQTTLFAIVKSPIPPLNQLKNTEAEPPEKTCTAATASTAPNCCSEDNLIDAAEKGTQEMLRATATPPSYSSDQA